MGLTIRAYNVLFGDCLLLSWDENDGEHHAWIDFGNFHNDPNAVFNTVYESALERTGGKLDLLVITHRHMDHLEGFYSLRDRFAADFQIERLWHAHVTPALDQQFEVAGQAIRDAVPGAALRDESILARVYRNNFGTQGITMIDRMNEILAVLPFASDHAVHRGTSLSDILPAGMSKLGIEILAPESDSSVYFEPLEHAIGARSGLDGYFARSTTARDSTDEGDRRPIGVKATDSPLIHLADFSRLRRKLRTSGLDILAAVDKTRNNTSIVLAITYKGTRLLLTGDAEEKSWETMKGNGADFNSRFVKIGHHGSINASPKWSFKTAITRRRKSNAVIVSTDPTRYTGENEVPKAEVVEGWKDRLSVAGHFKRTDSVPLGEYVEIEY
jgi:hypothetical protein